MRNLTGKTLGQYEIKQPIGQGGMAHVFKAYQPNLDRFVAVKILSPTLAGEPDFNTRFEREAKAVANLYHPHILSVHDYGVQDDYTYIVMHYVKNAITLRNLLEDNAPLEELIKYIVQVSSALNYAHKNGVIHRDVKPSNILIDAELGAQLSDFGLVKMTETASHLTGTGVLGTPAYMSPEQVLGQEVDHRTDIYALGVILHKVLTGEIPHNAPSAISILHKRSSEPVTPLRNVKPDIPESLEHVTLRSLAMDPDARYGSATDFAKALEEAKTNPRFRERSVTDMMGKSVIAPDGKEMTMVSGAKAPSSAKRQNMALIIGAGAAAVAVLGVLIFALFFLLNRNGDTDTQLTAPVEAPVVAETPTATPIPDTPTPIPPDIPSAIVKTLLEVRSGPGDEYDLLGKLREGTIAEITGQDEAEQWWQIKTSLAEDGRGWIKIGSNLSEATDASNMPIAQAPSTPTDTPTLVPADTPTSTATPIPDTPTSTTTPTRPVSTATPAIPPTPTATEAPAVVAGQFTLLKPTSLDEPTFGPTEFEWQWGSPLAEGQGFEVRVWRDGKNSAGVHNAVLDNKEGEIQALGNNTYRLVADIANTPGVLNYGGEYNWTVLLIQFEPEYKELGIQADPPGRLRFDPPGGGGGDDDGDDGGGGGGGDGGGSTL